MGAMRSIARASLLLFAAGSSRALAQAAGWESFGPVLFQVNAVATAPDETIVYAGSSDYAAGQSAIFRSTNGGQTWKTVVQAASGEFYSDILVDPRNSATIYAGTLGNDGKTRIYRSGDTGANWAFGHTVPEYCLPSFAPGATSGTALASCGTHLFHTADSGLTWQELSNPFTEPTRLTPGAGGTLLAYGQTTIFKSSNGGSSWQKTGNPLPCAAMNALRADPARANAFVAGAGALGSAGLTCGGVYRSADGGSTWTATNLSGVYVTDIAINTLDPTRVYASAGYLGGLFPEGGAWASTNGGSTWTDTSLPTSSAVRLALSTSGKLLYAATSIGVYALAVPGGQPGACAPDGATLCLDAARFRVRASWTKPDGTSGQGHAVSLTGDTGYFWFFDSANVETVVKVLEGCTTNGHRWVFASGLTNVLVNLTVTDVVSGTTNTYTNPQGTAFVPIQDTSAFSCN